MARLPQPGGDSGNWGTILNDYLAQTHKSDGTLKDDVVTAAAIADNTITTQQLSSSLQTTITQKYTKPSDGIPLSDLKQGDLDATYAAAAAATWSGLPGKPSVIAAGSDAASARSVIAAVGKSELIYNVLDYGVTTNGTTNYSAQINSLIATISLAGGGVVYFPRGTYICEGIELRTNVVLRGAGKKVTNLKAPSTGTADAVIILRLGPIQAAFIEDLYILGNGVTGQHGIHLKAVGNGGNPDHGGWWESGMRRVGVKNFLGHQIWLEGGLTMLLPCQFLVFEHVEAFSTGGLCAYKVTGQVGQCTYIGCQFEGDGVVSTEGDDACSAYIGGGYAHEFINCTFQENLYGIINDSASPVIFRSCYWENIGRAVLARGGARLTIVDSPNFSNAAGVSDNTGYLFRAEAASFIYWDKVKAGGTVNRVQSADTNSNIIGGLYAGPTAPSAGSSGTTKNIAESGGTITLGTYSKAILVNTSATPITTVAGTFRAPGEIVVIKAYNGPLTIAQTGNISIGKTSGTLAVPQDAWVQLMKTDAGGKDWNVIGMSPV